MDAPIAARTALPLLPDDCIRTTAAIDGLVESLETAGESARRLTLVCAPTGYGKSTAISAFVGSIVYRRRRLFHRSLQTPPLRAAVPATTAEVSTALTRASGTRCAHKGQLVSSRRATSCTGGSGRTGLR